MFAIDTNLLIYAHNEDSEFHKGAVIFLERVMNEQDENGNPTICFSTQVFTEFINVITRQTLRKPLSLNEAIDVVQEYLDAGVQVISHQERKCRHF
ncbi:MAG: PIN domain-containing protein [bacterium]